MDKKEIIYPSAGLICLAIGILIAYSGLNIHSGELFIYLIGVGGCLFLLPIILFIKSLDLILSYSKRDNIRIQSIILTAALGIVWVTILLVGFLRN